MSEPIRNDDAFWAKVMLHEKLPHCGCGDPAAVTTLIRDILQAVADREFGPAWERLIGPLQAVQQFVLIAIEDAELIEHGSYYAVPWLLDDGVRLLAILNAAGDLRAWEELDHQPASCPECNHVLTYEHQCDCAWCKRNWIYCP